MTRQPPTGLAQQPRASGVHPLPKASPSHHKPIANAGPHGGATACRRFPKRRRASALQRPRASTQRRARSTEVDTPPHPLSQLPPIPKHRNTTKTEGQARYRLGCGAMPSNKPISVNSQSIWPPAIEHARRRGGTPSILLYNFELESYRHCVGLMSSGEQLVSNHKCA